MIINDIEYDEEQIHNMMKNYNARKKVINDYAKRRYKKMKINLTCDDEELKKAAEDFITKNRDFSRRYYEKNDTVKKEYYNKTKDMRNAVSKYNYYKKNDKMDKFLTDNKFEECRELLKTNDNKKGSARSKYPELFE